MRKIFVLCLLLSAGHFSFAQKTFASKQEALDWLKETFVKYFVKTTVYKKDDTKKISYNYEIGEQRILIVKITEGEISETRYTVTYADIAETFFLKKKDYFKSNTGIGFKPGYGESYVVSYGAEKKRFADNTSYTTSVGFPFELKKDDEVVATLINAVNKIAKENRAVANADQLKAQAAKQKADAAAQNDLSNARAADNQKVKGKQLAAYKVFNLEYAPVNLYEYVEKNRRYKDKPTLLITWGHWCNICIRQIDTILNNGYALKYNIVLVSKEGTAAGFARLKEKIQLHAPDYTRDAMLLFDSNNQMEELDKNGTPFFLWMDKKLQITGSFAGYAIKTETIISKLAEIE